MGCGSCSSGGCTPAGCKSNGSCLTDGGCSKLDVYDWLSDMDLPSNYKPFPYVEVRFKGSRKDLYRNEENIYLEAGELVAVETATGVFLSFATSKIPCPDLYVARKISNSNKRNSR